MSVKVRLVRKESKLTLNHDGCIELRLMQSLSNRAKVGVRAGLERPTSETTGTEVDFLKMQLEKSRSDTLTVMSFDPAVVACKEDLKRCSKGKTIVALAGVTRGKNVTYIASDETLLEQEKISLASEDRKDGVSSGETLYIFESENSSACWAVLNCHDYSHVDLLRKIQDEKIELLVVVTYNAAHKLYWEYAQADVHRLFCFVVIANIGEIGGSGVFAPFRSVGSEKNAKLGAGGQMFGVKGTGALDVDLTLDIGYLRSIRQKYAEQGYEPEMAGSEIDAISPSQRFLATGDEAEVGPARVDDVEVKALSWNSTNPRVAFCQLRSMPLETYHEQGYRLDKAVKTSGLFCASLKARLTELELRCRYENALEKLPESGEKDTNDMTPQEALAGPIGLDFLVLPEVFVPRSFIPYLEDFSKRNGTIIVAGIDYPCDINGNTVNANECIIIAPGMKEPHLYRKITRSQYDARTKDGKGRMPLERGSRLIRFVNDAGKAFGVLICYDFSHFELSEQLNLSGNAEALDLLIVVAHNPYGDLYRYNCMADAHRFYQHIVMCNVSQFGGSGIFAPTRGPGTRRVLCEVGKGVEAIGLARLELAAQSEARLASEEKLHKGNFMRKPGIYQRRITFTE